jgi:hypothetical protein
MDCGKSARGAGAVHPTAEAGGPGHPPVPRLATPSGRKDNVNIANTQTSHGSCPFHAVYLLLMGGSTSEEGAVDARVKVRRSSELWRSVLFDLYHYLSTPPLPV